MKLPQIKKFKWNYPALAFAFPVVCFLILMIGGGYAPFGRYSMLYSDMYHQYFPFFKAFRAALISGDSLLFNWDVGMGMDYLGLMSYYLASPLNLLTVLMPESWMLGFFSLLVPIKLGLAAMFFALFLKKLFRRNDLSIVVFGVFYGMCAWALGYQWNIMWLDTFALLPLVALGTISLLRDKKFVLYTVSLFLSVWANYYVGFFTCIFVLLLFICYEICRCKSVKGFFADFVRIGVFTVLAIGMTAMLSLPTLAALQTTTSSNNSYPKDFAMNIVPYEATEAARTAWSAFEAAMKAGNFDVGLLLKAIWESFGPVLTGMRMVAGNMGGGTVPTFVDGLPNLYCGVGTIFFAFLFLFNKRIRIRDRICSVCLLVFFILSFLLRQLDYIWHGFHFTNQIPYRFSFLFSFVMLYMAYRAFLWRRHFKCWHLCAAGILSMGILLCSGRMKEMTFLAYNSVFLLLYFGFALVNLLEKAPQGLPKNEEKKELRKFFKSRNHLHKCTSWFLIAVMGLELVLSMVNFGTNFPCTDVLDYPMGTDKTASVIRYMKEREGELFYRTEMAHTQTLNDGALNSFYGITTFSSSANVKNTIFMESLGHSAYRTWNRYSYEDSSPVGNLFLGLKYLIERNGQVLDNSYFEDVYHYDNVHLLENKAYLPLGFLAEPELAEYPFDTNGNSFYRQSMLLCAASGIEDQVWHMLTESNRTIYGNNVEVVAELVNGWCSYKANENGGTLNYQYGITKDGFMCLDVNVSDNNYVSIWKNGKELYGDWMTLPQMMAVGDVAVGDTIELQIYCDANEEKTVTIQAGIMDTPTFQRGYDVLAASTLELTEFSNTFIEGTINCNRDGLLYTSIPQNGNWVVQVDGEDAEVVLVGDVMVSVMLTEGEHTVTFRYENKAFSLGWKISAVCLLAFLAICGVAYFPQIKAFGGKCKAFVQKFKK